MIDKESRNTIEGFMKKFICSETALLPSLCLIQKLNGHISEDDMEELSKILDLPEARIFSTASFYSMLSLNPRGRYHIQVCTNVTCSITDKTTLFEYISNKLGITGGESTPDGLFSLESVECIGACGNAPAIIINSEYHENLSFEKVDEIIDDIKKTSEKN